MPQKYTPPASAEVMSSFYDLSSLDVAARVKVRHVQRYMQH